MNQPSNPQSGAPGPLPPGWSYDPVTGQPVPSQAPPVQAPPARRSWFARHKVLTGLGVVVTLIVVASALGGGGGTSDAGASVAAHVPAADPAGDPAQVPADEPAVTPGIGSAVRDGKFEFTVTQIETGVARVGDELLGKDAQGQFVLLHVTVTNIGDEAQYFDGSSQKLLDTAGRTHSADSSAAIYLGDAQSFLNQINPGNSVQGTVVFDVPTDAVPASVELHDSAFSGGVGVALG